MYTVVSETRITLDTRFFGKDIIILTLKVSHNFLETKMQGMSKTKEKSKSMLLCYHRSLSILSPNPGVSTMVSEILNWKRRLSIHTSTRALLVISQRYRLVPSPFFSSLLFYLTPSSSSSKEKKSKGLVNQHMRDCDSKTHQQIQAWWWCLLRYGLLLDYRTPFWQVRPSCTTCWQMLCGLYQKHL